MESKDVIELLKYFDQSRISYMKLFGGGIDLILEKNMSGRSSIAGIEAVAALEAITEAVSDNTVEDVKINTQDIEVTPINSSSVGIVTLSKGLKKGTCEAGVKKGDILCVIEAMKIYNDVVSPVDGVITEIFVEDSAMVEFGQIIMNVRAN